MEEGEGRGERRGKQVKGGSEGWGKGGRRNDGKRWFLSEHVGYLWAWHNLESITGKSLDEGLSRSDWPVGTSLNTFSGVGGLSLKVGGTVPWPGALGCKRVEKAGQHQACIHSLRSSLLLVWLRCDKSFDLPKMMNPNLELSTKINTFSSKWLLVEIFFTAIKIILEHRTYRRREVLMFTKKKNNNK